MRRLKRLTLLAWVLGPVARLALFVMDEELKDLDRQAIIIGLTSWVVCALLFVVLPPPHPPVAPWLELLALSLSSVPLAQVMLSCVAGFLMVVSDSRR